MRDRVDRQSSRELLRDARYHRAAVKSNPKTIGLVAAIVALIAHLAKALLHTETREDERIDLLAALELTDYELDERVRQVELAVLALVKKNRKAAAYRAVFPKGLLGIVNLRGGAEALAVGNMMTALRTHFPKVAEEHGAELEVLTRATVAAEHAWRQAEAAVAGAFAGEKNARATMIELLNKNEGTLLETFPGEKARVRRFFRPRRGRNGKKDESKSSTTTAAASDK